MGSCRAVTECASQHAHSACGSTYMLMLLPILSIKYKTRGKKIERNKRTLVGKVDDGLAACCCFFVHCFLVTRPAYVNPRSAFLAATTARLIVQQTSGLEPPPMFLGMCGASCSC